MVSDAACVVVADRCSLWSICHTPLQWSPHPNNSLRDNHLDNEVVKRELRKAGGEFMAVHL